VRRVLALAVTGALLASLLVSGIASGQVVPRQPRDAADWATFTPAEREAAIEYQRQLLLVGLRDGTIKTEYKTVQVGSTADAPAAITASAVAVCGFRVRYVAAGRWVAGGGYTDATDYMQIIYASKFTKQGQFLRDGQVLDNWHQSLTDATHAEDWTGENFSWGFEHPTYVVKGWHGAQTYGGTWLVGPDAYCTHSYTP
jgi:hypothetical protein